MIDWRRWAVTVTCLGALAAPAGADPLTDTYRRLLDDPANVALNLDYARQAEARKEHRKALATYERILVTDPKNAEAIKGLARIRRIIEPRQIQMFGEIGAIWQSNPHRLSGGDDGELAAFVKGVVRDERPAGEMRWRTNVTATGEVYLESCDLDYGSVAVATGPVLGLGTLSTIHPAIGGTATYFDQHLYYGEGNASLTYDGYLGGAYQTARLRAGYRVYDEHFTSDNGYYVDATAKLSRPDLIVDNDALVVMPWLRYSDMGGSVRDAVTLEEFQPGRYLEPGGKIEYSAVLGERLVVGANLIASARLFDTDIQGGGAKRQDLFLAPGATAVIKGVAGRRADIRLDYRWENNFSNDAGQDFDNHVVTLSVGVRN